MKARYIFKLYEGKDKQTKHTLEPVQKQLIELVATNHLVCMR